MEKPKSSQLRALRRLVGSDDGLTKDELLESPRMRVGGKPVASVLTLDDLVDMEESGLVENGEGEEGRYVATSFARDNFPLWEKEHYRQVSQRMAPHFNFLSSQDFRSTMITGMSKLLDGWRESFVSNYFRGVNPATDFVARMAGKPLTSKLGAISELQNYSSLADLNLPALTEYPKITENIQWGWLPASGFGLSNFQFTKSQTKNILNAFTIIPDWAQKIREYKGWAEPLWDQSLGELSARIAEEGIPLIGACPPHLVKQLLDADDMHQREGLLHSHEQEILDLCRRVIVRCGSEQEQALALEAIESSLAGLYRSAQALNACLLDPLFGDYLQRVNASHLEKLYGKGCAEGKLNSAWYLKRKHIGAGEGVRFPVEIENRYEKEKVVNQLIFPLFLSSLHSFGGNDPVPEVFNRHATVHRGLEEPFSPINSLRSIMIVTAAIWGKSPVDYEDLREMG